MAKTRSPMGAYLDVADRVLGKTKSDAQFADFNAAADLAKSTGLKPMASHTVAGAPEPLRKLPARDLGPSTARPLLKRMASKRRMGGDR